MMQSDREIGLTVAAAGDVRTTRPTDDAASDGWFCVDGHLWLRKVPDLVATAVLARIGNPKALETIEITFDLNALCIRSTGATPAGWAKVPEAQALIDRVATHVDRALARVSPSASGPLPGTGATLVALPLPDLVWPDPVRGRLARGWRWLRRRLVWPGGRARRKAKARSDNVTRNLMLMKFDAGLQHPAPEGTPAAIPAPIPDLARFVQRLAGLVQPMEMQVALSVAQDRAAVAVQIAQAGRIDLLAGVSTLVRRADGIGVIRRDGAARERALAAYLVTRLVVVARCFEASWAGAKPPLSVTLTLADLPGTRQACLTVGAQGWGFGLAELALGLPNLPQPMPDGLSLRLLPVDPVAQRRAGAVAADVPKATAQETPEPQVPTQPAPAVPARVVPDAPTAPEQMPSSAVAASSGWIPAGQRALVQGRDLGGMIYLGKPPVEGPYHQHSKAFVDPALAISRPVQPPQLPYWPSYSDLSPQNRWAYLDWLAGPRDSGDLGFMFLYFYGLERRFFLDKAQRTERLALVAEVERLLAAFGTGYAAQRYLRVFLDHAGAVLCPEGPDLPDFTRTGYELPLQLKLALGRRVAGASALSADWLLAWLVHHPGHRLRAAAQRAFPEFRVLFGMLFDDLHPQGLTIRKPHAALQPAYRAASGVWVIDLTGDIGSVPDVTGSEAPVAVAAAIAEQAMQALDRFSRVLGRDAAARDTLAGYLALPRRLWAAFPNPGAAALRDWGQGIITLGGFVPVASVLARLGRGTDAAKGNLVEAADALAALGLGLAPDPRFGLRRPKADEDVVLFALPDGAEPLVQPGPAYTALQTALALGSFIAHADGGVVDHERAELLRRIAATADLTVLERAHLAAALAWSLAVPPDLGLLARRLKDAPAGVKQDLAQLALVVAASDGVLDPREIAAIERLYRALGLDGSGIYAALHGLVAGAAPVTVRQGQPEAGYAIPPRPSAMAPRLTLDRDRIAAVMVDTAQVAAFLDLQFGDPLAEAAAADPATPPPAGFDGLDAAHVALLADLFARDLWSETDFAALAVQHRLMVAGALETINEWSFDHLGDMMIENHDGYALNRDLVTRLQQGQILTCQFQA